jgi:hypothetical protein
MSPQTISVGFYCPHPFGAFIDREYRQFILAFDRQAAMVKVLLPSVFLTVSSIIKPLFDLI